MLVKDLIVALQRWVPDMEVLIEHNGVLIPITKITPQSVLVTHGQYRRWWGRNPDPPYNVTNMALYIQ